MCQLMHCSRSFKYYQRKLPAKDKPILEEIRQVVGNSGKGRIKVIVLVRKKMPHVGASRIRRIYQQAGYTLNRRLKRRVKQNPANPIEIATQPNLEWAMDFMSDALADGRKVRTINVIDHYNRACKGLNCAFSIPAGRLVKILDQVIEIHGVPRRIRTDNGPEFRSKKLQFWLKKHQIEWVRIQNGKPQQNAIVERFNRTFREDVLDANIFTDIQQMQAITDRWVYEYNTIRPHQSLNNKTPEQYAA